MTSIVYNEDCVEVLKRINSQSIDLTVTSPPYDNLRNYCGYAFDWAKTIEELYRVTKNGGVVVWIVSDQTIDGSETLSSFKQCLFAKECGFNVHDTMIWQKDSCAFPEATRYYPAFEYMFVWSKGSPSTFNPITDRKNKWAGLNIHGTFRNADGSTTQRSKTRKNSICNEYGSRFNVWQISSEKNNKTGHPAVFPLKLAHDHIVSWSNIGDTVLDPFLGSGTTRIAAYETNRNFIGCEISKEYFDAQEKRFAERIAQLNFFEGGGFNT